MLRDRELEMMGAQSHLFPEVVPDGVSHLVREEVPDGVPVFASSAVYGMLRFLLIYVALNPPPPIPILHIQLLRVVQFKRYGKTM